MFSDWIVRLLDYARSVQLIPGKDTQLASGPGGTMVSFLPTRSLFESPFFPRLAQGGVMLATGTIGTTSPFEPKIGKVPISGDKSNAAPVLKITAAQVDADTQTSFVALEVEADAKGEITKDTRLSIVHTSKITVRKGEKEGTEVAMTALALIVWAGEQPAEIHPIVRHNLRYARTFPKAGQGAARHFFWAV